MLLQAGNVLLLAAGLAVVVIGVDALTALLVGPLGNPGLGGFGAVVMLGGGVLSLVFDVFAYRWTARGERYAPLFGVLGWAVLWLPLSLAAAVLTGGHPAASFIATGISGVGIVLSLVALGSKKPR
jgi:hypothetical protein